MQISKTDRQKLIGELQQYGTQRLITLIMLLADTIALYNGTATVSSLAIVQNAIRINDIETLDRKRRKHQGRKNRPTSDEPPTAA